jgi:hypothetical protein
VIDITLVSVAIGAIISQVSLVLPDILRVVLDILLLRGRIPTLCEGTSPK